FVEFSIDQLSQKITPSDEDVATYYQENIDSFVVPENRHILQMVFDDKDTADKAEAALNAGGDFIKVAGDIAKQDKSTTDLGNISQDMLIGDLAEAVFALKKGDYTTPVKTGMGWHIMKVIGITPKKETTLAEAKAKIVADIRKELAYDQAQDVVAEIEDKLGAGATFEEIAKEYNANINKVSGIKEDGSTKSVAPKYKELVSSSDFVETAFSYNQGEVSQVVETDTGFAILKIEKINEAHQKDISKVRNEIEKMWAENEKSAIAQEIVNDVSHDLEEGDEFADVARRFGLSLKTTSPLKRGEAFAKLSPSQLNDIYNEKIGNPRIFAGNEQIVIVMPSKTVKGKATASAEKIEALRAKAKAETAQEMANDLIDAYASDYKVRVKYKYLGL
ncbi:MAG: peptidyl-prolyl cis-trans isomerase, partial [Alphaproteobacteria bacterium]|nr:peptidyl-prolyl cis-trans isomerase [Alphaproteobacteria bacterium]